MGNKFVCLIEKYRRILPVTSLSEVENPWKGISLNRCILMAVAVLVLSSAAELVQETLEPLFEVSEETDVQDE
ncbi:ABC transporter F family member 4-like protein, partial [Clarias magur]